MACAARRRGTSASPNAGSPFRGESQSVVIARATRSRVNARSGVSSSSRASSARVNSTSSKTRDAAFANAATSSGKPSVTIASYTAFTESTSTRGPSRSWLWSSSVGGSANPSARKPAEEKTSSVARSSAEKRRALSEPEERRSLSSRCSSSAKVSSVSSTSRARLSSTAPTRASATRSASSRSGGSVVGSVVGRVARRRRRFETPRIAVDDLKPTLVAPLAADARTGAGPRTATV